MLDEWMVITNSDHTGRTHITAASWKYTIVDEAIDATLNTFLAAKSLPAIAKACDVLGIDMWGDLSAPSSVGGV